MVKVGTGGPEWPPSGVDSTGTTSTIPPPPNVLPPTGPVVLGQSGGLLSFSNSDYGGFIPIVYGADRLTCNIFWASAPYTANTVIDGVPYTYQTVAIAAGICEGPINGVLRIWVGDTLVVDNTIAVDDDGVAIAAADGLIGVYTADLTDPAGPLSVLPASSRQSKLSVYLGNEEQLTDPVMVAAEGYEETPAYRGLAYVMIENFIIGEGTIPTIFFEISAHTSTDTPRVYGDLVDTQFDRFRYLMLAYDPSYDRFYMNGQLGAGPDSGLVVVDGNSLEELAQFEINTYYGIGPLWQNAVVMPRSGLIVATETSANRGILEVFNPLSGALLSTLGPGGGLTGNNLEDPFKGFGILIAPGIQAFQCMTSFSPLSNVYQDMIVGAGWINQSVALASVSQDGIITMLAADDPDNDLDGVLPCINNTIGVLNILPSGTPSPGGNFTSSAVAKPHNYLFYDGGHAIGTHVYGFSYDTNESVSIKVWRLSVVTIGVSDPSQAQYTQLASIPLNNFGGEGMATAVRMCLYDPSDASFLLLVEQTNRSAYLCKYNVFTGGLAWATPVSAFPQSSQTNQFPVWGLLNGGNYCWIDANDKVQRIKLLTGAVSTVISDLVGQDLPSIGSANTCLQYYNCYENSITYLTDVADQRIAKIFLDRIARTTIELSDIVLDLVERTGMLPSDVNVVDLQNLTVRGYTISAIKTIRACFAELLQAFTFDVVESNGKIVYKTRGNGIDATIPHAYVAGSGQGTDSGEWMKTTQNNDGSRIRKINLTYRDVDRDYAQNVQSVILTKYGSQAFDPEAAIDVTVPLAMTADEAVKLAEILLYAKLTYNTTYEFTLAPRYIELDAADVLQITMPNGEDDIIVRLRDVNIDTDNKVMCQGSEENLDIYTDQIDLFGQTGRFDLQRVPLLPGRVDPLYLTIPGRYFTEIGLTKTQDVYLFAFLYQNENTVLTKQITASIGTEQFNIFPPDRSLTWGYVRQPPNATFARQGTDFDSEVIVDFMNLSGIQPASAINGKADLLESDTCNLCYIAGELFQYVTATNISGDRWSFTELHRAKCGTELAVGLAQIGDRFLLLGDTLGELDTDAVIGMLTNVGTSPSKKVIMNLNTGNPFQPTFSEVDRAYNLRPFPVAAFQWSYVGSNISMTWQYASRTADGSYPDDGSVAPSELTVMPEAQEQYKVFVFTDLDAFDPADQTTYLRQLIVYTPAVVYTLAMQVADGFVNTTTDLYCAIQQTGSITGKDDGPLESHFLSHL